MNILELCLSTGLGGLELYVLKTVKKLNQTNNNVQVLVRRGTFLDERLKGSGIKRNYLKSAITSVPLFSAYRLARYITIQKIDVLHIHWGDDVFLAVLAKILTRQKVKIVYTRQMALTRNKHDFYHKFLYKHINAYVVIAQDLYSDARRYLPLRSSCLYLLYYGVPAQAESAVNCQKYLKDNKINQNAFKVAIFGRIEHGKGQYLVVEAVRQLKNEGQNIQAAMIGHIMDENYFKELEGRINQMDLAAEVHYLGFHNDPVSIMPCFDVVILASKCETFGLVLPEAMRAGVAVIGSNCGGVPEIIKHGETGLLFESENAEDLAKQLRKLLDNPVFCETIAKAGKADADNRFSEEKHYQRLLEIFQNA